LTEAAEINWSKRGRWTLRMTMPEHPALLLRSADSVARFVAEIRLLASALRAVALAAVALTQTLDGFRAGYVATRATGQCRRIATGATCAAS
jgi:hypothetical protein